MPGADLCKYHIFLNAGSSGSSCPLCNPIGQISRLRQRILRLLGLLLESALLHALHQVRDDSSAGSESCNTVSNLDRKPFATLSILDGEGVRAIPAPPKILYIMRDRRMKMV